MLRHIYGFKTTTVHHIGYSAHLNIVLLAEFYELQDLLKHTSPAFVQRANTISEATEILDIVTRVYTALHTRPEHFLLRFTTGLAVTHLSTLLRLPGFQVLLGEHPALATALLRGVSEFTSVAVEQIVMCFECGVEFVLGRAGEDCPACREVLSDESLEEPRMCWVDGRVPWSVGTGGDREVMCSGALVED